MLQGHDLAFTTMIAHTLNRAWSIEIEAIAAA
jgi:hypothetical protein